MHPRFSGRRLAFAVALCLFLAVPPVARPAAGEDGTTIAVIADGPWDRNEAIWGIFRHELVDLLGEEFGVELREESLRLADWTVSGVRQTLDEAFADPEVDVVLGLGLLASNELCRRGPLPKPAVAPFVVDPGVQGAPLVNGRSGVKNLSYIASVDHFRRDLSAFLEIVRFEKLAMLVTETAAEAIPGMPDRSRRLGAALGVDVTVVPVSQSGVEALAALPPGTEAVYVAPLLRMPEAEFDFLAAGLIERQLPSFSLLGREEVERGILAGLTPPEEFERIARRTALNIQRILLGEEAGELPVHFANAEKLALNIATARAIGVRPTWAILTIADRVDVQREVERVLSLEDAVREAVEANLDLLAEEKLVAAGEEEVKAARSVLLPQLDVSARGVVIDEDQARQSIGQAAERTLSGSARLSQILFSDDAWASLDVSRKLQVARERERDQLRLDIAQAAATAYLDVLRGKTSERIQRENLDRTETNLELARVRESIGFSGPGEVYRWEGEVAAQRRTVIDANSRRNVAEIRLNRLLHRPAEEHFRTEDVGFDDPLFGIGDPRIRAYLADPWSFRILREFLSIVAIETSPEIQALDQAIAAQDRVLANTGRAFLLPTVGLQGELSHTFDRRGEGSEAPAGPLPLSEPEDTKWNVGIEASLPLFRGGSRVAERRQARETLEELRMRRASLAEKLEERVRAAMHRAGSSFAGIGLSRAAAEAARKNYELVADAYSKGALDVIELLDAQNAALVADERAANAVYDFLVDYVEVERAAGFLTCLKTEAEVEAMAERLDAFREEREDR